MRRMRLFVSSFILLQYRLELRATQLGLESTANLSFDWNREVNLGTQTLLFQRSVVPHSDPHDLLQSCISLYRVWLCYSVVCCTSFNVSIRAWDGSLPLYIWISQHCSLMYFQSLEVRHSHIIPSRNTRICWPVLFWGSLNFTLDVGLWETHTPINTKHGSCDTSRLKCAVYILFCHCDSVGCSDDLLS